MLHNKIPPAITERYVYGLGFVSGANVTPGTNTAWMLPPMNYEIKDHSGNVRLTIPEVPATTFPAEPEAITSTHFYAFGSVQPYRNYNMGFINVVRYRVIERDYYLIKHSKFVQYNY